MKTQFLLNLFIVILMAWLGPTASVHAVTLETPSFRYVISEKAKNLEFIDRATGRNLLRTNETSSCASLYRDGKEYVATEAELAGDILRLVFGGAGAEARIKVESHAKFVVLKVESVRGDMESIRFLDVPLVLAAKPQESFGACALSLNLITRVDALPALQRDLRASAEKKFGLAGAKAALVAAPMDQMLPALQETLTASSELPICRVAGPWAHEIPFNHGSYLFNFGSLTESNLAEWIETTRRVGFTQIDNHGGGAFFRFGDFELNRQKWPDGWDAFKRIVARLHDAGIGSIFHTYAFFIDKGSKYVTPVPDPRLDAFRVFTVAEPISAEATEIFVNESTANMSTVTGFFEHNSVVLHLDDELVTFGGFTQQPPWKFTGVKRGVHGTKSAAHDQGTTARHLKECFGLFVPNPESSLFEEIAANHADVVNRCGFDGIYLDAIDGSSILRGGEEVWYWGNRFAVEIQKRLKKPVGMEMSAMWHHFWQYRTRWQAWDYPQRGHKRFIDLHAAGVNGGLMLPLHLGWWGFQSFNPPQVEPSYPDVIEHLGARLIGWDAGISLTAGVDQQALRKTPLYGRAAEILRTCEELRHAKVFDETTKARLRDPQVEFCLRKDADGKPRFYPVRTHAQTVAMDESWSQAWILTNGFREQSLRFRLEALISTAANQVSNTVVLANLARDSEPLWKRSSANGVSFSSESLAHADESLGIICATNTGQVPRHAAWARLQKRFEPTLDTQEGKALGLDIEGDGSGAVLAIRLESPHHVSYGAIADRYVPLNFTGRRRYTLVETESSRWSDYVWNDGKHPYHVYRETVNFGAIESVGIWLQNLPAHRETRVRLGPVVAVPLRSTPVKNPRLVLNGQPLEFQIELPPGSWIEGNGPEDCLAYNARGESLGKVTLQGDWPKLRRGANSAEFACEKSGDPNPRARITTFVLEDPF